MGPSASQTLSRVSPMDMGLGPPPAATSCCHILPARGAGTGFVSRSAPSPGGLRGNPRGARGGVGRREGARLCLEGSIPGPWGSQSLVFTCPRRFLGRGAHPDLLPNLDLCHSHPYSSHRGGVEVGVTQEVVSRAGLWHNPAGPGPNLPRFKGG